ncbi:MAG: nitrate/nitrite transporter NrtS [Rhodovibrionaceae bacterium]|nr:nitrate/nitrite transporter NrtS [Rhodovibrionaceae bacterium]
MADELRVNESSGLACWARAAVTGGTPRRAFMTALIVGPVLILINQWDALFSDSSFDWTKAILTIVVPYCVATVGACGARCGRRKAD